MKTKFEIFRSEGLQEIFVYQLERELVEVFYTIYKDCTIYAYKHENDWIELDYDGAIYETYANLTISSPNVAEDFEKEYIKYKREKKTKQNIKHINIMKKLYFILTVKENTEVFSFCDEFDKN